MITRSNLACAVPLCALLLLCSGCASQQLLAVKDRDIRDLRQQNASRQEALVKALKTIESVRAELGAARYEQRELEQKVARSSASIRIQQQTIDRLETQKTKLQEQLRQSELAYERLKHSYQDIKTVLSNTVTELAQTRRDHLVTTEEPRPFSPATSEHARLKRKLDELRTQVIRERAARRAAELSRAAPLPPAVTTPATPAPPSEDSSPWVWRLTEQPPAVETAEPGSLSIDGNGDTGAADSTSGERHVLGTAFLWTLGAVPAIGLTLLMFIVLVRFLSRPSRDTGMLEDASRTDAPEEESEVPLFEDEVEEEAYEEVDEVASSEEGEEDGSDADRSPGRGAEESEGRPEEGRPSPDATQPASSPSSADAEAATSFLDSLDWLDETKQAPRTRPKYSQDTQAVELSEGSFDLEMSKDQDRSPTRAVPKSSERPRRPAKTDEGRSDTQSPKRVAPKPAERPSRPRRRTEDGNSDTQMIEEFEHDEFGVTQVLPSLAGEPSGEGEPDGTDLGSRNQEFTETAVLDAELTQAARSAPEAREEFDDAMATDTQVLPPLLDFEDDSELDEALAEATEPNAIDGPLDQEGASDRELLAELEDLMGEKFEEPAL